MMDQRALAYGWLDIMVLGLGLFGLIYLLLDPLVGHMVDTSTSNIQTPDAVEGLALFEAAWYWAPVLILMCAGFALLARAVFESRMVGP